MMLKIKSVKNFRDFSEIKNKEGLSVKDGLFYRCGHLGELNEKDSLKMQHAGIKYVIDLRTATECREKPDRNLGPMKYMHIPLLTEEATGITQDSESVQSILDNAPDLDDIYYNAVNDYSISQLKKEIQFILSADGGVAFHCTAGKDRTGITALIILYLLDFDMETIMDNYLLTNKYMTKHVAMAQLGVFLKTFKVKYAKRIKMLFVVTRSCLESFIRAAEETYGSFDLFIKNGLGIDDNTKTAFKAKSLK